LRDHGSSDHSRPVSTSEARLLAAQVASRLNASFLKRAPTRVWWWPSPSAKAGSGPTGNNSSLVQSRLGRRGHPGPLEKPHRPATCASTSHGARRRCSG